jgi:hypothetical protein
VPLTTHHTISDTVRIVWTIVAPLLTRPDKLFDTPARTSACAPAWAAMGNAIAIKSSYSISHYTIHI